MPKCKTRHEPFWSPYVYLVYMAFLFFQPAYSHPGWRLWCLTIGATVVGTVFYLSAFRRKGRVALFSIAGLAALGYVVSPWNGGGSCFLIYAAAIVGFIVTPRVAFTVIAAIIAGTAIESWALRLPPWFWAPAIVITSIVGVTNVYVARQKRSDAKLLLAQEEVEHLAKVAERERIARDLHDVLGHTLSVIVLKSELASKLIDRDAERARTEMSEVERIAREALGEVRHAIRGYRAGGLAAEFARAQSTLESAGIQTTCELPDSLVASDRLSPAEETVLALILREAVTNVVRHSRAGVCQLRLRSEAGQYVLEVADDGRGAILQEGNGLRGMRERVEALDGSMHLESSGGTRLSVSIPVTRSQEVLA